MPTEGGLHAHITWTKGKRRSNLVLVNIYQLLITIGLLLIDDMFYIIIVHLETNTIADNETLIHDVCICLSRCLCVRFSSTLPACLDLQAGDGSACR